MIYFFYVILAALQKGSSVAKFGLQWLRTEVPREGFCAQEEMNGGC